MATEFGKILRKVRIDNDEILKNMADKLQISSAFLSAIENGVKSPPADIVEKIKNLYRLEPSVCENLTKSMDEYVKTIKINTEGMNQTKKNIALTFAREFNDMDQETLFKLRQLLQKEGVK